MPKAKATGLATSTSIPRPEALRNRVVERKRMKGSELTPNPANWKDHTDQQKQAIAAVLTEIGQMGELYAYYSDRLEGKLTLVDGHLRRGDYEAHEWDVAITDLNDEEADKMLAIYDPIGALAKTRKDQLQSLLDRVGQKDTLLKKMMDDLARSNGLKLAGERRNGAGETAPEPQPEQTRVQAGDLWQLGSHRVICADSTKPEIYKRLCGDRKPWLMCTDPPYGVEYNPTWRDEAGGQFGDGKTVMRGDVKNDNQVDWTAAYQLFEGDVVYAWHAGIYAGEVEKNLRDAGFEIRTQIMWRKQHFVLSRGNYHWGHEPCWYAVRKGRPSNWCGDRTQSTVWDIASLNPAGGSTDTGDAKTGHGTQKPIECFARPIRNHGEPHDIIYDPFGGSGSSLIAADRLHRVCLMCELDPVWVNVIIERWEKETGEEAKLIERL